MCFQWRSLLDDSQSPRNLMLHNIDEKRNIASVRVGDWKMIRGDSYGGRWDHWYGPSGRNASYDFGALYNSLATRALRLKFLSFWHILAQLLLYKVHWYHFTGWSKYCQHEARVDFNLSFKNHFPLHSLAASVHFQRDGRPLREKQPGIHIS